MKKHWVVILLVSAVIFFGWASICMGAVTLSWVAPEFNEDMETPLTDLAGYKIYYGLVSGTGNYTNNKDVGNVTIVSMDILELPNDGKTYYINIVAYDTSDNHSEFNGEISHTTEYIDTTCPAPPLDFKKVVREPVQ